MIQGAERSQRSEKVDEFSKATERLYPTLSAAERSLAAENLIRYFEIAIAIAEERVSSAPGLTPSDPIPTMKERSKRNLKT